MCAFLKVFALRVFGMTVYLVIATGFFSTYPAQRSWVLKREAMWDARIAGRQLHVNYISRGAWVGTPDHHLVIIIFIGPPVIMIIIVLLCFFPCTEDFVCLWIRRIFCVPSSLCPEPFFPCDLLFSLLKCCLALSNPPPPFSVIVLPFLLAWWL